MVKHSLKIGIIVALVVLAAGVFIAQIKTRTGAALDTEQLTATIFSQPRHFPQFTLTDDKQQIFNNAQLNDHWTLMFFGFSNCGSICPTTLAELAKVFRQLPDSVKAKHPQVVFVSVDPARDTPAQMQAYLNSFNPEFIGVTGEASSLAKLRRQLGILAMEREPGVSSVRNSDTIDHSGTILLINPKGEYVGVFSMPHDADAIATDLKLLVT